MGGRVHITGDRMRITFDDASSVDLDIIAHVGLHYVVRHGQYYGFGWTVPRDEARDYERLCLFKPLTAGQGCFVDTLAELEANVYSTSGAFLEALRVRCEAYPPRDNDNGWSGTFHEGLRAILESEG